MIVLDDAKTVACSTNSVNERMYNASRLTDGIGAVDTN